MLLFLLFQNLRETTLKAIQRFNNPMLKLLIVCISIVTNFYREKDYSL